MAFKKSGKKNLKIIAATSVAIFSLLVAFSGALSWFAAARQSTTDSSSFGVYCDLSDITAESVYCIKYDGYYGATATQVTENSHSLVMSEYDYIFKDRNINTPLFLRIEISSFDKTKDLTITVPCSESYKTGVDDNIDNKLSNVICTKFSYGLQSGNNVVRDDYTLSGAKINGGNAIAIYEGMRDRATGLTGTPFVSGGNKVNLITLKINKNTVTDTYIDNSQGDSRLIVYLEFDYYVTNSINLVEDYISSYDEPATANRFFDSDIGLITLKDSD